MRLSRTITASLAAVLGVAALAGPAAAGQQGANDPTKANVYVPPAALYTAAAANVYVPPAALYTATRANVYVPPAALYTAAPADDSTKADVYVPPAALYTATPAHDSTTPAASASPSSFDWGSAGIGGAVVVGALLIALGGAAGLRRRRQIQPAATA
jgi:hypothetical protein